MTDFAFESSKPEMYTSFYMALRDGWNKFPSIKLLPKLKKITMGLSLFSLRSMKLRTAF